MIKKKKLTKTFLHLFFLSFSNFIFISQFDDLQNMSKIFKYLIISKYLVITKWQLSLTLTNSTTKAQVLLTLKTQHYKTGRICEYAIGKYEIGKYRHKTILKRVARVDI